MSLGVSYEREYFETYTKKLRLTIDKNIKFIRPNFFDVFNFKEIETYNLDYGVLELKFLKNMSNEVRNIILDCVSISSGRHSKYSVGINLINK